jgi:hypothetical protein
LTTAALLALQAIATPRELLLNKVPFPLPTPSNFNLDQINALSVDNLVSEDGKATAHKQYNGLIFVTHGIGSHCCLKQLSLSRTWKSSLTS